MNYSLLIRQNLHGPCYNKFNFFILSKNEEIYFFQIEQKTLNKTPKKIISRFLFNQLRNKKKKNEKNRIYHDTASNRTYNIL